MGKNKTNNVFISHFWKDDDKVQKLKQRLSNNGYNIRNYSVDSTKHTENKRPSDAVIKRFLRMQVNWSGTFICLIGPRTHTRKWVNYEIEQAHRLGKKIVGVYTHGNKDNVELPSNFKKYGGPTIGWNSLDKLGNIMNNKEIPIENPSGIPRQPLYQMAKVSC